MKVIKLNAESKTDRQERIEGWSQEVLREATALVLGAGAIGNELLKNLALTGFGYALICDMDRIERSNLSRTVLFNESNLGEMKSEVAASKFIEMNVEDCARADCFVGNVCTELGAGVINHVDVVIGCLDNWQTRYEMNRRCSLVGKPYIDAGIGGLTCNVASIFSSEETSCWACRFPQKRADQTKSMIRHSCGIGAVKARSSGHAATSQVSSSIAAGFQANEVIKYLHSAKAGTMNWDPGRVYLFDGRYNTFDRMILEKRDDCPDHRRYERIDQTPISCEWTLRKTLAYVRENYGEGYFLNVEGDNEYCVSGFVTRANCKHCGKEIEINRCVSKLHEDEIFCKECPHETRQLSGAWEHQIFYFYECDEQEPIMEFTLNELGIPPLHILEFEHSDEQKPPLALEMTGDLQRIMPNLVKSE